MWMDLKLVNLSAILLDLKVQYHIRKGLLLVPALIQINPVHSLSSHFPP